MPLRHQAFLGDVSALCDLELECQQQPLHVLLAGEVMETRSRFICLG